MEKFRDEFFNEAKEQLELLESKLLDLETSPTDQEIISAVFRIMHTIKGGAGMFGFDDIKEFTHEVETAMEYVRDGKVLPSSNLVSINLNAGDHIKELLNNEGKITKEIKAAGDKILQEFRDYVEANRVDGKVSIGSSASQSVAEQGNDQNDTGNKQFLIKFTPAENVFLNGTNPVLLIDELVGLGNAEVVPSLAKLPSFSEFDAEKSYFSWTITLDTVKTITDIQDVFIFLDNDSTVEVSVLQNSEDQDKNRYHDQVLEAKDIVIDDEPEIEVKIEPEPAKEVKAKVAEEPVVSAPAVATVTKNAKEMQNRSLKIDSEKLDKLVDLVGELVTFNARLSQAGQDLENSNLISLTEHADRLITELRDISMGMRMLPIAATFNQFKRTVRDLSRSLNKEAQMITEGEDTELDKTVIERLNNPMMHLIRNSMDHGIETPQERASKGKPERGTIKLIAEHSGAFVNIVISDDGAGLNRERILAKAIEKGLVSVVSAGDLPDQEVYEMVFAPGFSTADKVTDVSGRGVGMDVVKKEITALGGTVEVSSTPGKGSRFTLKIPLTLAIIEGLMARINNCYYIFPLANVEECNGFLRDQTEVKNKTDFINWREKLVPYVNLRQYFNLEGENPATEQIVIVNDRNAHVGFVVDRVIGNLQTVIKPLGRFYRNVEGISGATILGDGTVALVLDMYKLADMISKEDKVI